MCANSAISAKILGISLAGIHTRIGSRKWLMSKREPRKYGDKVEQTVVGDPNKPIEAVQRTYRIMVNRPDPK